MKKVKMWINFELLNYHDDVLVGDRYQDEIMEIDKYNSGLFSEESQTFIEILVSINKVRIGVKDLG